MKLDAPTNYNMMNLFIAFIVLSNSLESRA